MYFLNKGFLRNPKLIISHFQFHSTTMINKEETPTPPDNSTIVHQRQCRCGCIPANMFSLFEMAELRRQRREQQTKLQSDQQLLLNLSKESIDTNKLIKPN